MKNGLKIFAALSMLICAGAFADTRPNPGKDRSYEETKALMKLGKYVRCSLSKSYIVQTKRGLSSPDADRYPREVLFADLPAQASSPSDFATYSLDWENKDISFYFYMNSQTGEIRLNEKNKQISAETDLDLSDFAKPELWVGSARLIQKKDMLVTDPRDENAQVPGELITYISGSCQFIENWIP